MYKWVYKTNETLDDIILISDGEYLTDLHFINSDNDLKKYENIKVKELDIFNQTCKWLDIYFSGKNPDFVPRYKLYNVTPFVNEIIKILVTIPYGETMTYGEIAKIIADNRKIKKMSSQGVGQGVGNNPICIIIPCHRVLGKNNKITGYSGGLNNKKFLLDLENIKYIL